MISASSSISKSVPRFQIRPGLRLLTTVACGLFLLNQSIAQTSVKGTVLDSVTGESLPFVHIVVDGPMRYGAVSNIEGHFTLNIPSSLGNDVSVIFSFVGYDIKRISLGDLRARNRVRMAPKAQSLDVVVIKATEDPAYEIMRRAIANRKENDPQNLPFFSLQTYNNASVDVDRQDSAVAAELDSTGFARAHFLMVESATRMAYKKPGTWSEKVIASKMSGVKNPAIGLLANSFQPFSIYTDHINVLEFAFLNPLSPNSQQTYIFEMVDTLEVQDEIAYVIRFQPRKNAAGYLMQGVITIGAENYAVVNFRGENAGDYTTIKFEIRQAYIKMERIWFPNESKTYYEMRINNGPAMLVNSTTYNDKIDLNTKPEPKLFGAVQVTQDVQAGMVTDDYWGTLRPYELDSMQSNTYLVYDTMPPQMTNLMSYFVNLSTYLLKGRLPAGKVDILLRDLLRINEYEGTRIGLGLATNSRLIKWMSVEGYYAYGFQDEAIKYGGGLRFLLNPKREFEITARYRNDVDEPGRSPLLYDISYAHAGERFRNNITSLMDGVEQYIGAVSYRPAQGWYTRGFFLHETRDVRSFPRLFMDDSQGTNNRIIKSEVGIDIRYVPREKLMLLQDAIHPTRVAYPRYNLRVSAALPGVIDAAEEYVRADFNVHHLFQLRRVGQTLLYGGAGKVWGNTAGLPYLYFGRGARFDENYSVQTIGYFQTMDPYEFLMDEHAYAGIQQSLGNVFGFERRYTKPELKLAYQAAIGHLTTQTGEEDFRSPYRQMDKPFLEGGLFLDNLFRVHASTIYIGFGAGVFYRHGYHQLSETSENFGYMLSLAVSI